MYVRMCSYISVKNSCIETEYNITKKKKKSLTIKSVCIETHIRCIYKLDINDPCQKKL